MSRRASLRMPKELRPVIGGVVLVVGVRTVDALWRCVTGRATPVAEPDADDGPVRDRLVYATLLGAALRIARRAGLPAEGEGRAPTVEGRPERRSPA